LQSKDTDVGPKGRQMATYNQDGSLPDCKNKKGNGKKEAKVFTLEAVQKKLESIGIIINVHRMMKQE
jgi:hypothetical protein